MKIKRFLENTDNSKLYLILLYDRYSREILKSGDCLSLCYINNSPKVIQLLNQPNSFNENLRLLFIDYVSEVPQPDFNYDVICSLYDIKHSNINILYQTTSEKEAKFMYNDFKEKYTTLWSANKFNI